MSIVHVVDCQHRWSADEMRSRKIVWDQVSAIEARLNAVVVKRLSDLTQAEAGWLLSLQEGLEEWTGCLMDSIAESQS